MNKSTKSIIQFIVLLSIGIFLVWLSLKSVWIEKDRILASFKQADYFWIIISILISILSHYLRAFRWNYLLNPLGYSTKPINALCAVIVGYFANYGLPRMGELTRCTLVAKYDKVPFEVALGTVITERIVDFLLLMGIFILTLLAQFKELKQLALKYIFDPMMIKLNAISANPTNMIILITCLILICLGFYLIRKKFSNLLKGKFGKIIEGFGKGLSSVKDVKHMFQFVVLSVGIWACYFYSLYVCFYAFDATSSLGHSECLVLLLFGTFGVVFSPGGLGAYPLIIKSLLVLYGIESITAFAFPWMVWGSQFIIIIILGLLSLIILPLINKTKEDVVL